MTNDNGRVHVSVEKSWLIGIVAAIAVTMIGQFIGMIWWAGSTSSRLSQIDSRLSDVQGQIEKRLTSIETQLSLAVPDRISAVEKVAKLEQQVADLSRTTSDLDHHIAAVETYLHTQVNQRR